MSAGEEGSVVVASQFLACSEKEETLLLGYSTGTMKAFGVRERKLVLQQELQHHGAQVLAAAFHGDRLVSGAYNGELCIWRRDRGKYAVELLVPALPSAILSLSVTGAGHIVCGCADGSIRMFSMEGTPLKEVFAHLYGVTGLCSGAGNIVSVGADGRTKIWAESDLSVIKEINDHTGPVSDVCVCTTSYDTFIFATCGKDGSVFIYAQKGSNDQDFDRHKLEVDGSCVQVEWCAARCELLVRTSGGTVQAYVPSGRSGWKEQKSCVPTSS